MRFIDRLSAVLLSLALALPPAVAPAFANDLGNTSWSELDGSNNAASPNGWASGTMLPSQVEPTARAMMGALKRWYDHQNATLTSGGTPNAQTLTYTQAPSAYVTGDLYVFKAGFTNTGAMTLNINSLGATAVNAGGSALVGGEIQSGMTVGVVYDGTVFQLAFTSGIRVGVAACTPQQNTLGSGSGTYTAPTCNGIGPTSLEIEMEGGGGSGASSGTALTAAGSAGGATTFGTRTANPGAGGLPGGTGGIASGGTTSGCTNGYTGNPGQNPTGGVSNLPGGNGGPGHDGGGGSGGSAGTNNTTGASANSGAGGGGGGGGSAFQGSGGGGAGGYCHDIITSPAATYSYAIGGGGGTVTAGTGGAIGANGGAGYVRVTARWGA